MLGQKTTIAHLEHPLPNYTLQSTTHPPPSALSHFHKITNSLAGFGGRWSPFSSPLRIVSQFVCASLGQVRSASGPPPPPPPLSSPHSHNPTQRCRLSQFRQRSREKLGKSRQQQHSLGPPPPPPTNQPPPSRPLYTMSAVRQFVHETSRPKMEFCAQFNYIIIII